MTDAVNDDDALIVQDFENDPVMTFSNLVQTTESPFERVEFRGVKIHGEPSNRISDAFCNGAIEFLKLFAGRF